EMVKSAKYSYTQNVDGQYQVSLEITLTDEGQAKIQELSGTYAFLQSEIDEIESAEEANSEDSETTENTESTNNTETAEGTNTENTSTENQETQEQNKKIATLTIAGTEYSISKIDKNKITVLIGVES